MNVLRGIFSTAILAVSYCLVNTAQAAPTFATPAPINFYDEQNSGLEGPVAIAGDTLVIGEDVAYVYERISGVWVETARLSTTDTQASGYASLAFGYSLAISPDGGTIFVAYPGAECPGNTKLICGEILVYEKPLKGWADTAIPTARLRPSVEASEELGLALSISSDGSTLAAYGDAAYIFSEPTSGWADAVQTAILGTPSGAANGGGSKSGISIDGGVVAVDDSGSVLVYGEPAGGWQDASTPTATLTDSGHFDSQLGDFGSLLKVSGSNVILVGAPALGLALIYQEPGGGWVDASSPTAVLQKPAAETFFPNGMSIIGTTAVVSGGAGIYFYDEPAAGWSSESPTSELVPGSSGPGSPPSEYDDVYVTGTELAVTSSSDCGLGPSGCPIGYVLSTTPAGNYGGMLIGYAIVEDTANGDYDVISGNTGDEFNFDFDVANSLTSADSAGMLEIVATGGTLKSARIVDGGSCQMSNGTASCPIELKPIQSLTVQATVETAYDTAAAAVSAKLVGVSPQSWDQVAATLASSVPLIPVPVVPTSVSFSGAPYQTITGVLPVSYAGKAPLVFALSAEPDFGALTLDTATGAFTWAPPPATSTSSAFIGKAGFGYYVSDGSYNTRNVSVNLDEQPANKGGGGAFGLAQFVLLLGILAVSRRPHYGHS